MPVAIVNTEGQHSETRVSKNAPNLHWSSVAGNALNLPRGDP